MARKTASDLAEKIVALTEDLTAAAAREARCDIADALRDMIKGDPEDFAGFLSDSGVKATAATKNYLPGHSRETFTATPDFLDGIRWACAALRDPDFDL